MNTGPTLDELFDRRIAYPDFEQKDRLDRLFGLDHQKDVLAKILGLLVDPKGLVSWAEKHYSDTSTLLDIVLRRPPLIVLAGDVGSIKTELAETIGDKVAHQEKIDITLFPMSLSTRGQGRVGEMTQLISSAFEFTFQEAKKYAFDNGNCYGVVILLVDEADALAQSREFNQMHHEDRAGVNAFIRGIDQIANAQVPAAIIMCTNRLNSLDPTVKRRAAEILNFSPPDDQQRYFVLSTLLKPLKLSTQSLKDLVSVTGVSDGRKHGFTFSDLNQCLIPAIVLDAYPKKFVDGVRAVQIAQEMIPTSPFREMI